MPSSVESVLERMLAYGTGPPLYRSFDWCPGKMDGVAIVPSLLAYGTGPLKVMSPRMGLDYFGVFDGCFGTYSSNHMVERLHVAIAKEMESELHAEAPRFLKAGGDVEGWWRTVVREAFHVVDDELVTRVFGSGVAVGSPAVVALVLQEYLVLANRGATSMAVIYRDEEAVLLTSQHNPEPYKKKENGDVHSEGGHVVRSTLKLEDNMMTSRAKLFMPYFPEPEVLTVKREPRDKFLILATGGFWAHISPTEACRFIQKKLHMSPSEMLLANTLNHMGFKSVIAKELAEQAILRGSRSNVTVLVILFKNF